MLGAGQPDLGFKSLVFFAVTLKIRKAKKQRQFPEGLKPESLLLGLVTVAVSCSGGAGPTGLHIFWPGYFSS